MAEKETTLDREIRRLEIKRLATDDPKEKEKIFRKLVSAKNCREFLSKMPGQDILLRDGIEIR